MGEIEILHKKLKRNSFKFHHEISTDGVAMSILYSRRASVGETKLPATGERDSKASRHSTITCPSRSIGLDPGKKNIITMVDCNGISLRYTTSQWNFKSRLTRYLHGHTQQEKRQTWHLQGRVSRLCTHSWKTIDPIDSWSTSGKRQLSTDQGQTNRGMGNSDCFASEEAAKTGY